MMMTAGETAVDATASKAGGSAPASHTIGSSKHSLRKRTECIVAFLATPTRRPAASEAMYLNGSSNGAGAAGLNETQNAHAHLLPRRDGATGKW